MGHRKRRRLKNCLCEIFQTLHNNANLSDTLIPILPYIVTLFEFEADVVTKKMKLGAVFSLKVLTYLNEVKLCLIGYIMKVLL